MKLKTIFTIIGITALLLGIYTFVMVLKTFKSNYLEKGTNSNLNKPSQAATEKKSKYGCILEEKLCMSGVPAKKGEGKLTLYSLVYSNLPTGAKLKAPFSGRIGVGITTNSSGDTIKVLTLTNDSLELEANYYYLGTPKNFSSAAQGLSIKRGDEIGEINGDSFTYPGSETKLQLVFSVMNLSTKEFEKISLDDFK